MLTAALRIRKAKKKHTKTGDRQWSLLEHENHSASSNIHTRKWAPQHNINICHTHAINIVFHLRSLVTDIWKIFVTARKRIWAQKISHFLLLVDLMMFAGISFEMIERFVRLAVSNMCAVCRPPLPGVSLWQCGLLDNANNYIYNYGFHIVFGGNRSVAVAVESRSFSRTMHRIDQWKSAVARPTGAKNTGKKHAQCGNIGKW